MKMIKIAYLSDLNAIVQLRVEQQIEDWIKTSNGKDYSIFADEFEIITKNYICKRLNKTIYFALMYIEETAVSMCALEIIDNFPQITVCENSSGKSAELVSVFTAPKYRGKGYMQILLDYFLDFAVKQGYTDIVLSTNTPDAKHIYEKFGFQYISDKYYLKAKEKIKC